MKCPREIIGKFDEWSNTCQECTWYKSCMEKSYNEDKNTEAVNKSLGDNFPPSKEHFFGLNDQKKRKQMINDLFFTGLGKITQDDIVDLQIDLWQYNKNCRKQKIKRQYKRRKNDSL